MSTGNRGKYAEGAVKKYMAGITDTLFTYHRFPDAHAGSMVSAPADFMFLYKGKLTLLEVKEVDTENRLPYGNFDTAQVARMKLWRLAGADTWVLVYFKEIKRWRMAGAEWFENRPRLSETGRPIGSWKMETTPTDLEWCFKYMFSIYDNLK